MSGIGTCQKCHGPLCVSGRQIACEKCGTPEPDHPLTRQWKAEQPAPPEPQIPPADYVASGPERLRKAERAMEALLARVGALEQEVLSLKQERDARRKADRAAR